MRNGIRRIGLILGLALVAAVGVRAGEPDAAHGTGAPKIVVEKPTLDLGVVREGETVRAVFVIENAGEKELRILRAKPS